MVGIYKIENKINHKVYIGQSKNLTQRLSRHKVEPFNTKSHAYEYPLYRAIRKYGIENFSFDILEECELSELNALERKYIEQFNSYFGGYNQTFGGDVGGKQIEKEKIIGIIQDLETTNLFHKEIADKWNVSTEMVDGINTGRHWRHDRVYPIQNRYSYVLRQQKTRHSKAEWSHKTTHVPGEQWFCVECNCLISRRAQRCRACEIKRRKEADTLPISRKDLKILIRNKSFLQIGKQFNISDNGVRRWCQKYDLPYKPTIIKQYTDEEWEKI